MKKKTGLPDEFEPIDWEEHERIAQKALKERPSLSLRARLIIGFLLFFVFIAVMIITTIVILNKLDNKTQFLVIADRYTNEIQQARRFEKNYFLYGTNLEAVLEHAIIAQELMKASESELKSVLGEHNLSILTQHLEDYLALLRQLEELDRNRDPGVLPQQPTIEKNLREHGSLMVSFALELSEQERQSVRSMFTWAKRWPLVFLVVLLALAIWESNFLARQMIGRLTRLMNFTKRIAEGDFSPIMPARKYRDEFSNVNMALNSMMHELNRRQELMIESHKLRAIGTLTAGVAHELNNPINNITLTAAALEEDYADLNDDERIDMIKDLVSQAERSGKIVKNLLDFARESEIKTEQLNLGQLLQETLKLAQNEIKLRKVHVDFDFDDNLPSIHGDRQQLSQVFLNLILNSLDAMKDKKGRLEISIARADTPGFLVTEVKDNGSGIPSHILHRIFEPFFTTKSTGKGTGLGLSVSLGIIQRHGGDIRVESAPGLGSVFQVLLPITEVPAAIKND